MSVLIANADGNLTGSTTFAAADTSSLNLITANLNTQGNATSQTSVALTIANGKVIDGVLLCIRQSVSNPTGTFKVDLQKSGVSQASVTVNKTDILADFNTPSTASLFIPIFFKFTSTATGDGTANWTLVITTTGTGTLAIATTTGTSTNWTRALRTTTAATPAAADDLYIVGELTGAGTHNSRAVTMNSTAATAYGSGVVNGVSAAGGGIRISNYATLSYGTSASTNYVLRVNGDLSVFQGGTLNIGSSGAEIPRTSTAVLEFAQTSASGDFGLQVYNLATFNAYGLSRTSGKNVVSCKLTADFGTAPYVTAFNTLTASAGTKTDAAALDPTGFQARASTFADSAGNSAHFVSLSGATVAGNTTQVANVWLKAGTGTRNRFVRLILGSSASAAPTNGFFADIDLTNGTIGSCTAIGNGTATSSSITPYAGGYLCQIVGKVSSASATPSMVVAACSAAGTTSYTGDATQCFIYYSADFYTAASLSTSASVDTDTGWLSGDVICVAGTLLRGDDSEYLQLASNAGASSLSLSAAPVTQHSGTASYAGEVINLTRNVKIRSTSSTLMAYIYATGTAVVTMQWVEVYFIGLNGATKHGIELDGVTSGTAGAKNISYCSMHDGVQSGIYSINAAGATSLNWTHSYNVYASATGINFYNQAYSILNATDYSVDNCIGIACHSINFILYSMWGQGTFTNCTAVGGSAASGTIAITGTSFGTISGHVVHSTTSVAYWLTVTGADITASNLTAWRTSKGMIISNSSIAGVIGFTLDNFTSLGATVLHIQFSGSGSGDNITIKNSSMNGDAVAGTAGSTFQFVGGSCNYNISMDSVVTNTTPSTTEFAFQNSYNAVHITTRNCNFGVTTLDKSGWAAASWISHQKLGQVAGNHVTEMTYGQLKTDSTIYNSAAPSMRMTPNSASIKLESAPKGKGMLVPVLNAAAKTVSVYARTTPNSDISGSETFNASDKSGTISLSNGNLTATGSGTSDSGARGVSGISIGKAYVEFTAGATWAGADSGVGIATAAAVLTTLGTNATNAAIAFTSGNSWYNGSGNGTMGTGISAGSVVCMALDMINKKVWFRLNNNNWMNGAGGADPANNVGGIDISSVFTANNAYPAFCCNGNNTSVTANFGGSAFTYTAPTGFTSWNSASAYNGNAPRLIARANPALGLNSDTVISNGDSYWDSVVFLWEAEGTNNASPNNVHESSKYARTISVPAGSGKFDTTHALYGSTSYFPGTSELTVPASIDLSQLAPTATSPFTLEVAIFNGSSSTGAQWDILNVFDTNGSQRSWLLRRNSGTGELTFYYSTDGSSFSSITTSGAGVNGTNTWYKICVENSASKLRIYVNGVMKGSGTLSGGMFNGNQVMAMETPTDSTTTWADHIRITKGVARYNSDGGYTPDTGAFPTPPTFTPGTWTQLTGPTPTPTDDGAFEVIVDCDGTTGYVNVDDWTAV